MRTAVVLLTLALIVLLVLALGYAFAQRERTRRLRLRFGPEYDHAVERTGSRREAEEKLETAAQRRDQLQVRALTPDERERWEQQWARVQSQFVDQPAEAVTAARELLPALMQDRGYPTGGADTADGADSEERTAILAADHPVVVGEYRAAEAAYQRHLAGEGTGTESLRQSLIHYRALFEALIAPPETAHRQDSAPGDRRDGAGRRDPDPGEPHSHPAPATRAARGDVTDVSDVREANR